MQNLFAHVERLENSKTTITPSQSETCKILKVRDDKLFTIESSSLIIIVNTFQASHAIDLISVINFFPTLFNQLFNILAYTNCTNIAVNIIRLLIHIVDSIQESGHSDTLNIYIKVSLYL